MSHLLDTNACISHLRHGASSNVTAQLLAAQPGSVYLCSVVVGEVNGYHSCIILEMEALIMAANTTKQKSWVQQTPNVCGGAACIRNTRITVHGLVHYRQLGLSDQRLLEVIQGLTQDDLDAAWDYYAGHSAEIDEAIRLNEEA